MLTTPPHGSQCWALSPVRLAAALGSHGSLNPTVNRACEGSGLCAPYENLMPDNLILYYINLYNYFIMYHNLIIMEIKFIINVICLNHPETILPPQSMAKLSSTKLVPGAKNVGDY